MFLRIRPIPDRDRCKAPTRPLIPRRKPRQAEAGDPCLLPTGPNSVALTVPQSRLVDPKRGRTEVFDGFSAVFSPDSTQVHLEVHHHSTALHCTINHFPLIPNSMISSRG